MRGKKRLASNSFGSTVRIIGLSECIECQTSDFAQELLVQVRYTLPLVCMVSRSYGSVLLQVRRPVTYTHICHTFYLVQCKTQVFLCENVRQCPVLYCDRRLHGRLLIPCPLILLISHCFLWLYTRHHYERPILSVTYPTIRAKAQYLTYYIGYIAQLKLFQTHRQF